MSSAETKKMSCRLLIVEDDYDDMFLLKRALDSAQRVLDQEIECEHVDNGRDAVFLVSRDDQTDKLPDALILDLNMPKLNGVEFLKSLRNSLMLKDIPVYVLTTTATPSIQDEATQAGADRIYVKPNDKRALDVIAVDIVSAALEHRANRL